VADYGTAFFIDFAIFTTMRTSLSTILAIAVFVPLSLHSSFAQGPLIPYRKGNLWGYSDSTGRVVIAPKYELAGQFFRDRAWVKNNGLFWYIDPRGKRVIKKKFAKAGDFEHALADVVSKNRKDTLRINIHGKSGYGWILGDDTHSSDYFDVRKIAVGNPRDFDKKKEFYGRVGDSVRIFKFDKFRAFRGGDRENVDHAVVTIDGQAGVINEEGVFALQPVYDAVSPYEDLCFKVQKDGRWAYFDKAGNKLTDFEFDNLGSFNGRKTNGRYEVRDYAIVKKNGKSGVIGADGKLRTEIKFENNFYFKDGLALILLNGKSGYINKYGKEFFED
jgi:hypothetical protein